MRRVGQVFGWISFELVSALGATKVVGFAGVFQAVLRGRRVDGHAANRIFHNHCRQQEIICHVEPRTKTTTNERYKLALRPKS